ncbi:MAG: KpsF/GutQ family sugar-phosphate isomerase [Methylobacteriaceae bacterium]|nr:KpsF/GutQ family sugar-phosphate isomerase [Methylobacteriaceae bacterium]
MTPARVASTPPSPAVASALRTLAVERAGIAQLESALAGPLGAAFDRATAVIGAAQGRVIVSGMGKSGHVGRKIAATLASTGTPAYFVHPGEASHGDLGMIRADDAVLALSWSGETPELADIITYARRFHLGLVAITANADSALGRAADVALVLPKAEEACPNGLAPTTSTTMQLALGDALAVALLEARGFTAQDFRIFHPGGRLGAKLTLVRDLMHRGSRLPLVKAGSTMAEAVVEISAKGLGCVGVVGAEGRLVGIITDGDLRRHMRPDLLTAGVEDVMTPGPQTIAPETLAAAALDLLNSRKITTLFVIDERAQPCGVVHLHDLLRLGAA